MLRRLFSYMHQYKKFAVLAIFCVAAESVFELIVPLIMADLVDVGVAAGDKDYIYMKGLQMIICAAIALVLGIGSARFSALAGQGLGAELRKAEYEKLQGYSFANIDHFRVSSLVTRLTSDVTNIQNSVSTGLRPFCRGPVMLVAATGVAFFYQQKPGHGLPGCSACIGNPAVPDHFPCKTFVHENAGCRRHGEPDHSGKSYCYPGRKSLCERGL